MNILVAVDLSDCTDVIVEKARELAEGLGAKIWFLHVAEPEPDFVGYEVGPPSERDALAVQFHREHAAVQAFAKDFRAQGLDATALLVRGATAQTILQEASKLEADIVVVGSHGRGAVQRLLVGSISEGVIRHAATPVLVVPTHKRSKGV